LFEGAVLYRALRQDPWAVLEIFKPAAKNTRYFSNVFFYISGVRTGNEQPKVSKNHLTLFTLGSRRGVLCLPSLFMSNLTFYLKK
jgi:hypothetical protein